MSVKGPEPLPRREIARSFQADIPVRTARRILSLYDQEYIFGSMAEGSAGIPVIPMSRALVRPFCRAGFCNPSRQRFTASLFASLPLVFFRTGMTRPSSFSGAAASGTGKGPAGFRHRFDLFRRVPLADKNGRLSFDDRPPVARQRGHRVRRSGKLVKAQAPHVRFQLLGQRMLPIERP